MRQISILALTAAIALGGWTAGCSRVPDNEAVAAAVKAKFAANPDLQASAVGVTVLNGQATLTGQVPTAEAQLAAYKAAAETPGVSKVVDQLQVQPMTPPPESAMVEQTPVPPAPAPPAVAARTPKPRREAPKVAETRPTPTAAPDLSPTDRQTPAREEPVAAVTPRQPEPARTTIPVGTRVSIRMIDAIDSGKDAPGETFRATLASPIEVDGDRVVPAGADVAVRLANAKAAGRISGSSELELQLAELTFGGETYRLNSNSYQQRGSSRGKQSATRIGIGAAAGAIIGGIAGGGKGAGIGAAVGGGSTAAYQVFTRGKQVRVPSETMLDFELESPVTVAPQARRTRR